MLRPRLPGRSQQQIKPRLVLGHVLRSGYRLALEQEMRALLTLCQLLRMAMVDAVETRPGTDGNTGGPLAGRGKASQ